jgi:hypothetical protein
MKNNMSQTYTIYIYKLQPKKMMKLPVYINMQNNRQYYCYNYIYIHYNTHTLTHINVPRQRKQRQGQRVTLSLVPTLTPTLTLTRPFPDLLSGVDAAMGRIEVLSCLCLAYALCSPV